MTSGLRQSPFGPMPKCTYLPPDCDESLEWVEPKFVCNVQEYKGGYYKINPKWEVISPFWNILKYRYRGGSSTPVVVLRYKKKNKDGNVEYYEKEVSVKKLMERFYGTHFPWYSEYIRKPEKYILTLKDWDPKNMDWSNFVYEKNLGRIDAVVHLFETLVGIHWFTSETMKKIAEEVWVSVWTVLKCLEEWNTVYNEYKDLKNLIQINFSMDNYEIYKLLIQTWWELTDTEVVNRLWFKEMSKMKGKIAHVRKILTENNILQAVQMVKNKNLTGKTFQEISQILNLSEDLVANLYYWCLKEYNS